MEENNNKNEETAAAPHPPVRIVTMGGDQSWGPLLAKQTGGMVLPAGDPQKVVSEGDFKYLKPYVTSRVGIDDSVLSTLQRSPVTADQWVTRIQYLMAVAEIALIDTEVSNTALGHEFLRTARDLNVPVIAIGVSHVASPLLPVYARQTVYPRGILDITEAIAYILHR